jgi:SAM-dependent methyltransferase
VNRRAVVGISSGKYEPLEDSEISIHRVREILDVLEETRKSLGYSRSKFRILDIGCGKGSSVAGLIEAGYDAYGVDVDPKTINASKELFSKRGWDHGSRLRVSNVNEKIPFDSGLFHFVFSQDVIEHIDDLDSAVGEFARVSHVGAINAHTFPTFLRPVEAHLLIPFVHWLKYEGAQKKYIEFLDKLGFVQTWKGLESRTVEDRANIYTNYLRTRTCYRKNSEIKTIFQSHGFEVEIHPSKTYPKSDQKTMEILSRLSLPKSIRDFLIKTFICATLYAKKVH